jgi:Tol biopolymer transport system component
LVPAVLLLHGCAGATPLLTYPGEVDHVAFSPDGRKAAYAARGGDGWHVVVEGRKIGPYGSVHSLSFSPDGRFLAYAASIKGQAHAIAGSKVSEGNDSIDKVAINPDGAKVSFGAVKDGGFWWKEMTLP